MNRGEKLGSPIPAGGYPLQGIAEGAMKVTHELLVKLVEAINTNADGKTYPYIFSPDVISPADFKHQLAEDKIQPQLDKFIKVFKDTGISSDDGKMQEHLRSILERDDRGHPLNPSVQEQWWSLLILRLDLVYLANIEVSNLPTLEDIEKRLFRDREEWEHDKKLRAELARRALDFFRKTKGEPSLTDERVSHNSQPGLT